MLLLLLLLMLLLLHSPARNTHRAAGGTNIAYHRASVGAHARARPRHAAGRGAEAVSAAVCS